MLCYSWCLLTEDPLSGTYRTHSPPNMAWCLVDISYHCFVSTFYPSQRYNAICMPSVRHRCLWLPSNGVIHLCSFSSRSIRTQWTTWRNSPWTPVKHVWMRCWEPPTLCWETTTWRIWATHMVYAYDRFDTLRLWVYWSCLPWSHFKTSAVASTRRCIRSTWKKFWRCYKATAERCER